MPRPAPRPSYGSSCVGAYCRGLAVATAAASALLLTGCAYQSPDAFAENLPVEQADAPPNVVRTPEAVSTDLPYTNPPLTVPLPGPTGGAQGVAPTSAGEASPGEGDRAELDQE